VTPVRYIAVQVLAYAIDYGSFAAFCFLGAAPWLANLFSKVLAGAVAFQLHRRFTFRVLSDRSELRRQALRYTGLLLLNAPLTSLLLVGILTVVTEPLLAKLLADVLAVAVTYALTKTVVFRQSL